jgi:hypothetical protein
MWIDYKYVNLISNRLPLFKIKNTRPFVANFRCVICGDSQKSKNKARGYIIEKDNNYYYCCHNGCPTRRFRTFLKDFDERLYTEYNLELMQENGHEEQKEEKAVRIEEPTYDLTIFRKNSKVSQLSYDHPVKRYIEKRCIDTQFHAELFFVPKFFSFINGLLPGKFKFVKDLPFLVIPLLNKQKRCFGVNARCLSKAGDMRYITIMFRHDMPKIYGLHRIQENRTLYVTEGPIDSMFLSNAIAMCGSDVRLQELEKYTLTPKEKIVIVYDNEPRNEQLIKKLEKTIDEGFRVVIWPKSIIYKDINEMIMNGHDKIYVQQVIKSNTYSGIQARLKLSEWRRI